MWPGRVRSAGRVRGSIATFTVWARSEAEIPVDTFRFASIDTQKAVLYGEVLSLTMSGMSSSSRRSSAIGMQIRPRP